MDLRGLLALLRKGGKVNYFVVCPDQLGLQLLLPRTLEQLAAKEDITYLQAENITREKARQLADEARKAPMAGSNHSFMCIAGMQRLPFDSAGALLKVVEEAKYTNFIFQAQTITKACRTLRSRSVVVHLPFLERKVVLGNLQAMNLDAQTAEDLNLYDGTLSGTAKALAMKDTVVGIRRELRRGSRGSLTLQTDEIVQSLALIPAIQPYLRREEDQFLKREDTPERRRLMLYLLAERGIQ